MKAPRIKPAFLNPKNARSSLSGADFHPVVSTIEKLSGLYDSLEKLQTVKDPDLTPEKRAMTYRDNWKKANESARNSLMRSADHLDALERNYREEAAHKAGLNKPLSESAAQEIRATLRAMPQKERDKVLRDAALNGDAMILKAVRDAASPWLVGEITVPVETLVDELVQNRVPELRQQLDALHEADNRLKMAGDAFMKETNAMREPHLEHIGDKAAQEALEAKRMFAAAVSGELANDADSGE